MKTNKLLFAVFLSSMILGWQGCSTEDPFITSGKGEGVISFETEFNSDVALATRAEINEETLAKLENNLTVYIENSKGVIRKYNNKNDIPKTLTLAVGNYVIEGWTGDSVTASFSDKFYRGKQTFTVEEGQNNPVTFKINIANVIVSIDASSLESNYSNLKVTVNNSRGSLTFDSSKIETGEKGYFMMPDGDNNLNYKVEITSEDGSKITKEGLIQNVQRAYEYKLKLSASQSENDKGGALVKIEIQEVNVLEQDFEIFPAPSFKATYGNENFDLQESQIVCVDSALEFYLRVVAYGGLSNLSLNFDSKFNDTTDINGVNLRNTDEKKEAAIKALQALNIIYEPKAETSVANNGGKAEMQVYEGWFKFEPSFFQNLKENDNEYTIEVKATDGRGYSNNTIVRIARSLQAVENNLIGSEPAVSPDDSKFPMSILANVAELEGTLYSDEITEYGIEYRKHGTSDEYTKVYANNSTRAGGVNFKVTITNLEPGTTYEYKAFCKDLDGEIYEEKSSRTFTTESKYEIPNWNMELWSTDTGSKKDGAILPSANGIVSFWDTGNHGSISMSKNLTSGKTDFMANNTVACLQSQFVGVGSLIGKFAAGNLFVGEFGSTVGMDGAKLDFGREYNGSHPSALKVKVNYRPGKVDYTSSNSAASELVKNENDYGQVYIALATSKSSLNTAEGTMFDKDADNIIAYGQVSWNSEVAEDSQLEEITIPIKYYKKAQTNKPQYLIIVCSASKYGDYFAGSSSSVLYLDDFELEYGDIQWQD